VALSEPVHEGDHILIREDPSFAGPVTPLFQRSVINSGSQVVYGFDQIILRMQVPFGQSQFVQTRVGIDSHSDIGKEDRVVYAFRVFKSLIYTIFRFSIASQDEEMGKVYF